MDVANMFDLSGRVALVTGGSRGIGAMVAEGLVAAGCRVYITARTSSALEATAARLSELGGECRPITGDLSTSGGIDDVVAAVAEREDELHVLVNNAAVESRGAFAEFSEDQWDTVMDLNLKGVFFMTQRCLGLLKAGADPEFRSSVINMSSITAEKTGAMRDYAYRSAKAGLNQLTRMLAKDLARDHINVNAIAPGFFESEMTAFMFDDEALMDGFRASNPIPRPGHPEEIAGLVIYLAARSGDYVTGSVIDIDGGLRFT